MYKHQSKQWARWAKDEPKPGRNIGETALILYMAAMAAVSTWLVVSM